MDDIAEHKKWLKETTHNHLKRSSQWRRRIKIGLVLVGAFVAAGAGAAANLIDVSIKWPFYACQILGGLMVLAGGAVMEFIDEGAADAIQRANLLSDAVGERDRQISSLEVDFVWFTRLYATARALRDIVEDVISANSNAIDVKQHFAAMLDVVVADKSTLFGIDSDRWNFAVYIFNPETGKLECLACRRPIRAEEDASHRSWSPGEGHVGVAFQTQREIVAGDTSAPEARALFDSPDIARRDEDRKRYRSIASLPIRLTGDPIRGILVATSDIPCRFRFRQKGEETAIDPIEPLRILASALAFAMKAADLQKAVEGPANHE